MFSSQTNRVFNACVRGVLNRCGAKHTWPNRIARGRALAFLLRPATTSGLRSLTAQTRTRSYTAAWTCVTRCPYLCSHCELCVKSNPQFMSPWQVYGAVVGSNSCYEFQARFGEEPVVCSRRLPCRCEPCRALQRGADPDENHCVLTSEAGNWKATNVAFKSVMDITKTKEKKSTEKAKRAAATALKVARLVAEAATIQENPECAPNPQAAVAAADLTDAAAVGAALRTSAAGLSAAPPSAGTLAFAAAYGAEDSRAVAVCRGETEFLYQRAAEHSNSEEEGESGSV
jgi:hypothetical protein